MAFLKDDDKDNEPQSGMNVLGEGSNISQPQEAPDASAPTQVSAGGGQTIQSPSATPSTPQAPAQRKSAPKGSGMFTDIRKYVTANKPQAAKMAGAVGQKFEQKAQNVGQAVEASKQKTAGQIAANRQRFDTGKAAAQSALEAANQGQMSDEQVKAFQDVSQGTKDFRSNAILDVAKQRSQAQDLKGMATGADSNKGTGQMLRQTFKPQAAYSRGQESLDKMILGGDQAARKSMVDQVRGASTGLQEGIRGAQADISGQRGQLAQDIRTGREELTGELTGTREGLTGDISARAEQSRQDLAAKQADIQAKSAAGTLTQEDLQDLYSAEQLDNVQQQAMKNLDSVYNKTKRFGWMGAAHNADLVKDINRSRMENAQTDTVRAIDMNAVKDSTGSTKTSARNDAYVNAIKGKFQELQKQKYEQAKTGLTKENLLSEMFAGQKEGQDLSELLKMTDASNISESNVVTEQEIARQRALNALAGRQGEGFLERNEMQGTGSVDLQALMRKLGVKGV